TFDALTGEAFYAWEDLPSGHSDFDYNDLNVALHLSTQTISGAVRVATGEFANVAVTFQALPATKTPTPASRPVPTTTTGGEVGVFFVDDANGTINGIAPGQAGYTAAALARAQIMFANGTAVNTSKTLNLPGEAFLGFYYIPNGSSSTSPT